MVGHRHGLGKSLGFVVHSPRAHRIHVAPITLRLRMDLGVAVDLGGGGQQKARGLGLGEAERLVGAERTDLERLDGQLEIVDGTGGRGEVQYAVELALDVEIVGDVVLDKAEPRVAYQVRDVVGAPGDEVVHPDDVVLVGNEPIREVRAQKPRRSGDEDPHGEFRPMPWYSNPSERMRAGSYRLRPSMTSGRRSACFMRSKSGLRYTSHSVT